MTQRTHFLNGRAWSEIQPTLSPSTLTRLKLWLQVTLWLLVFGMTGHGGAWTGPDSASSLGTESCDVSLPISIALEPMADPRPGARTPFEVAIKIGLDPDDVRSVQIEYDLPESFQTELGSSERLQFSGPQPTSRFEIALTVPDERRYSVRARLIVELTSGQRLSESAVCWIDIGSPDRPPGMVDRLVDADGSGIRVYRGKTRGRQ